MFIPIFKINKCFICSLEKDTFDKQAGGPEGFRSHIAHRGGAHNMWAYLYFIIYIWEQDKDDDDGLELDIRHLIHANNTSWFPLHQARVLEQREDPAQVLISEMQVDIRALDEGIIGKIGSVRNDLESSINNIMELLNSESKQGKVFVQKNQSTTARNSSVGASGGQRHSRRMSVTTELTDMSRRASSLSASSPAVSYPSRK